MTAIKATDAVRFHDSKGVDGTVGPLAGLYPDPKRTKSVFGVARVVGYTKPDVLECPSAQYRVVVGKRAYEKTKSYLASLPQARKRYDLFAWNCNHLVYDVAGKLGHQVPGEPNDSPDNNVRGIKSLNGGRDRASWR